jgi:hypothetical protein
MITRETPGWAARRRFERSAIADRGSLSQAIEAQRRLDTRQADGTEAKADRFGRSDPRYAYVTQSHD